MLFAPVYALDPGIQWILSRGLELGPGCDRLLILDHMLAKDTGRTLDKITFHSIVCQYSVTVLQLIGLHSDAAIHQGASANLCPHNEQG